MTDATALESRATRIYYDRTFAKNAVKVLPGEFYVTTKDMVLVTTLGSCVAACIRDTRSGIGGINHFMLPEAGDISLVGAATRYGAFAMEVLVNEIIKAGGRRSHLEAKVFGGGRVLDSLTSSDVGERNAAFVREYLKSEEIRIAAEDLLDEWPRKVYFFPESGKVLVKKLRTLKNQTLAERESEYRRRIRTAPISGDIELFG